MAAIVDTHVHLYTGARVSWGAPTTATFPPEKAVEFMDGPYVIAGEARRVERALVQPTARLTLDPALSYRAQHELVIEACRRYPDRLAGNFMFNPQLDVEAGVAELERLVREEGFRSVKLHPTFHCYFPHKAKHLVWPIFEAARRLNIGVMVHTGDPPFAFPVFMAPVAEAFPDVPIVLAHLGTQRAVLADEAIEVARTHENVWVETSSAQFGKIKEAIETLGATKVIHASDSPYCDIGAQLRMIEVLCREPPLGLRLHEEDRERIFGGNAVDVFGL
jgi:predicted TIM-barrel fold metal-dependent hydrolase